MLLNVFNTCGAQPIRTIDKSRLKTFVCKASDYEMEKIDTAIGISLGTYNRNKGEDNE